MQATIHSPNPLTIPVGALMRPTNCVAPEDTLERAATELRRNGSGILPVVGNNMLLGVVTDTSLAVAMAEGVSFLAAATEATVDALTIAPYATGAEALRRLAEGDGRPLVVIDDMGHPMGLVSAADLYPRRRMAPRPAMVGGMATPFGVYLTTGSINSGATGFALVTTGMTLFTLLTASNFLVVGLANYLEKQGVSGAILDVGSLILIPALFLGGMRLLPLAGTHGAEHQVVHAIERGEELTPSVVRRMPRVHPRCGTNLAVGASIYMGLLFYVPPKGTALGPISLDFWSGDGQLRFIVAAMATFFFWRPLGSILQQYVTTRPPTERQLEQGIKAGQDLLDGFATSKVVLPSIPRRLWNSGLFHVIVGSALLATLVQAIGWYMFHVNLGLW